MTDLVDVNYRESSGDIYCDHLTNYVSEENYIRTGQMSGARQAVSQ